MTSVSIMTPEQALAAGNDYMVDWSPGNAIGRSSADAESDQRLFTKRECMTSDSQQPAGLLPTETGRIDEPKATLYALKAAVGAYSASEQWT